MEEEMSALEKRSESGLSWNYLPLTLERDSLSQTFTTQILPLVRPAWRDCHVQTKVFTDGITNVLLGFYVSREGSRDQEKEDIVLLRMNGEGTEVFLDRRAEILVMLSLHNANLVPPLYLELANGLCYGYIPGRPFTMDDMQVVFSCRLLLNDCATKTSFYRTAEFSCPVLISFNVRSELYVCINE